MIFTKSKYSRLNAVMKSPNREQHVLRRPSEGTVFRSFVTVADEPMTFKQIYST